MIFCLSSSALSFIKQHANICNAHFSKNKKNTSQVKIHSCLAYLTGSHQVRLIGKYCSTGRKITLIHILKVAKNFVT